MLKLQPTYSYLIHEATDNEEWFCGRDVCLIFGFRNIKRTLFEQVKRAYKSDLKSLIMWDSSSRTPDTHNEGKAHSLWRKNRKRD